MRVRRFLERLDTWAEPVVELWAGCIVLVVSASFWISPSHPIWDLHELAATVGAIVVGPLLVYRAWTRNSGSGIRKTGAQGIGFWMSKAGQRLIAGDSETDGVCDALSVKRALPFPDAEPYRVLKASSPDFALVVGSVMKDAVTSEASMIARLKAQALATLLNVYFSDPALGGNKLHAYEPIGNIEIDLTHIGASGDVRRAFGGAEVMTVTEMLFSASAEGNEDASVWYANDKEVQELAMHAFEAVNARGSTRKRVD